MNPLVPSDRHAPVLFDALPDLARSVPWTPLVEAPTPVEPCDAIAPWLGRDGVFMKRDDLASSLYGGNKIRRYEFLLAEARARGANSIVTVGGIASTQVMATALLGRAHGFRVSAVLFDQPVTAFARSAVVGFVDAGADLVYGGGYVRTAWRTMRTLRRTKGSYFIMPGAASPLANLGYVDAAFELAAQVERREMPRPDVVVLPTGSAGTLVGLALGFAHLGWPTEVVGVRITTALACNRWTVGHLVRATDRFIARRDARWTRRSGDVRARLYGGALGRGYGYPTDGAREGAAQIERLTGAPGETTYSGKALAGLKAIAARPEYRDKTLLLWNTLSTPRPVPSPGARQKVPRELEWVFERDPVA